MEMKQLIKDSNKTFIEVIIIAFVAILWALIIFAVTIYSPWFLILMLPGLYLAIFVSNLLVDF